MLNWSWEHPRITLIGAVSLAVAAEIFAIAVDGWAEPMSYVLALCIVVQIAVCLYALRRIR